MPGCDAVASQFHTVTQRPPSDNFCCWHIPVSPESSSQYVPADPTVPSASPQLSPVLLPSGWGSCCSPSMGEAGGAAEPLRIPRAVILAGSCDQGQPDPLALPGGAVGECRPLSITW